MWSASRQAAALRSRELSSRELLDAHLAQIELHNERINAVVTLDVERGMSAAAAADQALARGESSGPLHGLPITVKDALNVAGMRSTGGAVELTGHVPTTNADVVEKVTTAGAFCFGKTNVPKWSGDLQTFNEIFGTTNNPHDPSRVPGGSSGGPAAAVALGMTSFEIGTDIGGSIRVPAAYCGVYGHKPSYGLVPCGGYLDGPEGGLTEPDVNVHGPIARAVEDLELLLDVMAGPRPDRSQAWRLQLPPARTNSLDNCRVAVWSDDPACRVTVETRAAIERVAGVLEGGGARVDPEARPAIDANAAAGLGFALVGAAISSQLSHNDWLVMDRKRARIRHAWAEFFQHHDVLICPVIATTPFPHLQEGDFRSRTITIDGVTRPYVDLIWWTILIGMAYLPSTVIPVGRTADGLPIGVQIVGPYLEDRTTMAVARCFAEHLT